MGRNFLEECNVYCSETMTLHSTLSDPIEAFIAWWIFGSDNSRRWSIAEFSYIKTRKKYLSTISFQKGQKTTYIDSRWSIKEILK